MLSPVDEIKNKLDVVEVVSGYIKLQKSGRNFRANCPFHSEKTPSFFVSPERQIWHCFGCGKGGDIFGFVKEIEGLEFIDVLRMLALRAGVVLKKQDPKLRSEKERLHEICELACKFFEKQLEASVAGKKMEKYLLGRGLKKQTIKEWRIGYAPDDWHALEQFLKSRGYKDSEIIKSGVVVEKESGIRNEQVPREREQESGKNYYDRFRDRIIFPISDLNGSVIGFAGRVNPEAKDDGGAKYINTPQTLIYDKSRILYGLNQGRTEMRQKNACVIVEGYTDVIMSHQAEIKNTMAPCGTSLTDDQLKIVKRYTENLVLAFDMDIAGDSATKRAIDLAIIQGFNVKIVQQTANSKDKDPADLIKESPDKWKKIIEEAEGIIEYYFATVFSKHNPKEVSGKKEIAKIILPVLKKIPDKIEQSHWLQKLAGKLNVQEKTLQEALKNVKAEENRARPSSEEKNPKIKNRQVALEEELMGSLLISTEKISKLEAINCFLKKYESSAFLPKADEGSAFLPKADEGSAFLPKADDTIFASPSILDVYNHLKKHIRKEEKGNLDVEKWKSGLTDELQLYIGQILFQLEIEEVDASCADTHFTQCLEELKKERIKQLLSQMQYEIKKCEQENDKEKLQKYLNKFKKLANELIS